MSNKNKLTRGRARTVYLFQNREGIPVDLGGPQLGPDPRIEVRPMNERLGTCDQVVEDLRARDDVRVRVFDRTVKVDRLVVPVRVVVVREKI